MAVEKTSNKGFEGLRVYQLSEKLSGEVWTIVKGWDLLARDTMGRQLIRAADSIGANIAEGTGRGSFQDNRRFVRNARGSLYETRHWLRRAHKRRLLSGSVVNTLRALLDELGPRLNAYLRSIGPVSGGRADSLRHQGQRTKDKGLFRNKLHPGDEA
jgi:four helix bundle protein